MTEYFSALDTFDVRYVIDDRPQVCDIWRELGLRVMQVVDPGIEPPIARKAGMWDIIDWVREHGAQGAVIQQSGQMDVQSLLDAGWTFTGEYTIIDGKRVRMMRMPT